MNMILNFLSTLIWIPAWLIRLVFILIGLPAVAFALIKDNLSTPSMWKLWIDVKKEEVPLWFVPEWWSYLYVPIMAALAWWSYDHWHALVTIYFIFTAFSSSLVVYSKSRWRKFWWFAIRNPTMGLRTLFKQPILEPRPNPDDLVYGGLEKSTHRFLRHGAFSEYWYLRAVGDKKFEFRIGWKFSDGTPGFIVTWQLRLGD